MSNLAEKVGVVAAKEFEAAEDWAKPKLLEWIDKLPSLSDETFALECQRAIYDSALCQRFRGNWEHEHCRASACHHESRRRMVAVGHDRRCNGENIYTQAYASVLVNEGHQRPPQRECDCRRRSAEGPERSDP